MKIISCVSLAVLSVGALAMPASAQATASPKVPQLHGRNLGEIKSYNASQQTITFNFVRWYQGAAGVRYAAGHKQHWGKLLCGPGHKNTYNGKQKLSTCALMDDYLIADESPQLRTLKLTSNATVRVVDQEHPSRTVRAKRTALKGLLAWVTLDSRGRVTSVKEQYTP